MAGMAEMLFTADELEALALGCASSLRSWNEIHKLASSETIKEIAAKNISLYNSLRTACTEARWGLMTPEERAEDVRSRAEARDLLAELKHDHHRI